MAQWPRTDYPFYDIMDASVKATRFDVWLAQKHPDVQLLMWQTEVAQTFSQMGSGMGKTFLIRLLAEYDAETQETQEAQGTPQKQAAQGTQGE
jgi:type II secretory pathway predicted ATPase ExeA